MLSLADTSTAPCLVELAIKLLDRLRDSQGEMVAPVMKVRERRGQAIG